VVELRNKEKNKMIPIVVDESDPSEGKNNAKSSLSPEFLIYPLFIIKFDDIP